MVNVVASVYMGVCCEYIYVCLYICVCALLSCACVNVQPPPPPHAYSSTSIVYLVPTESSIPPRR